MLAADHSNKHCWTEAGCCQGVPENCGRGKENENCLLNRYEVCSAVRQAGLSPSQDKAVLNMNCF